MKPLEVNEDKRFSQKGNQNYEVKKIWDHQQEIVRRLVLGQKATEIAKDLGISPQTVSNVRNNALVKQQIEAAHVVRDEKTYKVKEEIAALVPLAVKAFKGILSGMEEGATAGDKRLAAVNVMDYAGHKPVQKSVSISGNLTEGAIEELKKRARAVGIVPSLGENKEEGLKEEVVEYEEVD